MLSITSLSITQLGGAAGITGPYVRLSGLTGSSAREDDTIGVTVFNTESTPSAYEWQTATTLNGTYSAISGATTCTGLWTT